MSQEKLRTMSMQNFWGVKEVHYGIVHYGIVQVVNRPFYRYGGHFGFHCFRYLLWAAQGANTY